MRNKDIEKKRGGGAIKDIILIRWLFAQILFLPLHA
jgi:hypothetical protein